MDGLTVATLLTLLEMIRLSLGDLYSSFVFFKKDAFDEKTYDEKLNCGRILGAGMLFECNHGRLIFHEKHELLFKYAGLEFIMQHRFLPFSLMSNIKDAWKHWLFLARVRVRRSSGQIQSGLLDLETGLVVRKGVLFTKVSFFTNGKKIRYDLGLDYQQVRNPNGYEMASKYVPVKDLLEDNPGLRFNFEFQNPLDEPAYEKYIAGDGAAEDLYRALNKHYMIQLQSFVDGIMSELSPAVAERLSFSIYQCEDEMPMVEQTVPRRSYAAAVVGC